ncbi:PGF-CTERM sorting domain-containing protein [Halorubrum vacuolatum]|uniref:PGF-CTERM sorting domain-containing protein n=1 Tax=Halorubrum vacuolatum TaxID=63740 RepID=UPI001C52A410|nr:PGF-CTERM sorting domain-containing protein [Halorubrum vacuolatum]
MDTTEGRLIGVTYPSDIELEGPTPDGELTTTVTRDDDVSEDYFIEFVVSPRQDVDAGIETEVENTDGDDFLEATVDVSDLPSAEYNLFFDIYEDEAGGLNNRIISLPEVGGLEIIDQGNFEIQEVEIDDDDVTAGEDEIETTVTIENTGDEDTQDVELLKNRIGTFDDERVDSESVSLEAGETTEVPLAYETAVGDDPGVQLDVQTQTSVRRGFIAAVAPGAPEFRITEVDATGDKTQGGDVDLEATVENIGNTDGSVDVEFAFARDIDFDDGSTTEITVDPGETETATVSGTIEQEPRAGDHSVPVDARISTEEGIISSPSTVGTTVAIDYGDIESGVDAATAGDQVLVTAGQYTEAVTIDTDDVVVSGVESGVEVEADGETPFTLAADGTGVSNVAIEDDVDTSAVSITGDDAAVVLADIAGFDTAVEIDNGATGATLIGNDVTVDRMDPAVDVQGSDTSIISNVFVPDEEAAAGDVIRLDEAASDTEIRDNTILTTPLGGNSPAAISVGDDESLAGTEVIRNNFDALAEDDLPVEGESPVDIAVDPEEPANELDATNNYAAGGSLTLESAGINEQDTSDEPLSADFEIADFSIEPDDDVEVGEEVIVSATVENDGDQTGSDNVQFDVDETEFGSGSVTVDPEETEPVEFRFTPGSDEAAVSPLTLGIGLEDAAVEASDEIDVIEPADVTVDETSVDPSEVQAGEPITVGAELENIGDIEASPTVELRVGPNIDGVEGTDYVVVASDDPTIADGDTEPIEFTDATVPSEAIGDDIVQGVNQVGVATAADSDADLLNIVSTPGVFDVTIDDFDDTVEVGETGSVDVTISNTGDEAAQQDVEFVVDGERESLQEFDLDEGADASETFTYQLDSDDVGEIPIEIQSEDDIDTRTVTVEADTPSGSGTGGGGGGGGGGADAAPAGPTAPDTASVTANARERILDTEPDVDGTGVTVEDTALDSIRFDEDTLRGSVDVFELDEVPTDAPALADGQPFVSGFIIELDDDELTDESATLTATLPADQVSDAGAEPEDLVVLHAGDDEYDELETSVEANGDVTVTAETPGFSTFIVTADVDEPEEADDVEEPDADDDPEPADDADDIDEPADDEPDDVDDDTPGFGALVALVALLAAALLATRRRP